MIFPSLANAGAPSGPEWLRDRRQAAIDALEGSQAPSTDEEIWRYSRIGELDTARFTAVDAPGAEVAGPDLGADAVDAAARIRIRDGYVVSMEVDTAVDGLTIQRIEERPGDRPGVGAAMPDPVDVFARLNDAFSPGGVVIEAARNAVIDRPILIEVETSTPDSVTFPRLVVITGELAEIDVVELRTSSDAAALSLPVTELAAGVGSRLRHTVVQALAHSVWQLGSIIAVADRDAKVLVSAVGLGGDYARDRIETRIAGSGAHADIQAIYFGEGDQMLDYRTVQDHLAPHTGSNLLFKGAVGDHSHSVYTGNIRIAKDAGDVDAFQTNRNLKLSEHAWAESVPNLEIENNDVRCSHASAIGPIDADHRFYLEARGVPPEVADRLVVAGFFGEVLERFPVPEVSAAVSREIAQRLESVLDEEAR